MMQTWLIVILSIIAVLAIALLIFMEVLGDDFIRLYKLRHRRGEYINDLTAVICQTIKETDNSEKAYSLFVEYIFANNKQFIQYVRSILTKISEAFSHKNEEALSKRLHDIAEMKIELKDQKFTQDDCMDSIDPVSYIESAAWIHLCTNCKFAVNDGLKRLARVCIDYNKYYTEPFPEYYNDQLEYLVGDIKNICNTILELTGTGDIAGMRELRCRMDIILSESYSNTQRLYDLLHDGRSEIEDDKRIALKFALNAFQELHCMIYTLRRFVLCNICITLSLQYTNDTPASTDLS